MNRRFDLDNDPGFFTIVLNETEKKLDVFEQNNIIYDLQKASANDVVAFQKSIAKHLGELLDMPEPPSTAKAVQFQEHISAVLDDVKKKLAGPQPSPTTTPASTPSPSNDGNEQP